jgi:ABC-type phosphate/phosphonate transport system ATPase subunit
MAASARARDAALAWDSYPLVHKEESLRTVRLGRRGRRHRFCRRVLGLRHKEDVERASELYLVGLA